MRLAGLRTAMAFLRYSASQVFASKFVYFTLLAVALFVSVTVVYTLDAEAPPDTATVYYFLLVPGIVLVFYPAAYSIQHDQDAGMLETLFGIPDYRFKVWLVRLVVQLAIITILLAGLAMLCRLGLAHFSVPWMVLHLMFPLAFLTGLGFLLGALFRSGNGAAVSLVVLIVVFWVSMEPLGDSPWSLFHNPFARTGVLHEFVQSDTNLRNRAYLAAGTVLSTLFGLLRLRDREGFI